MAATIVSAPTQSRVHICSTPIETAFLSLQITVGTSLQVQVKENTSNLYISHVHSTYDEDFQNNRKQNNKFICLLQKDRTIHKHDKYTNQSCPQATILVQKNSTQQETSNTGIMGRMCPTYGYLIPLHWTHSTIDATSKETLLQLH